MTAPKGRRTRRQAPPGWYRLQDVARRLGVSPNTLTGWIATGFIKVGHPYGRAPLVSEAEFRRVLEAMRAQAD